MTCTECLDNILNPNSTVNDICVECPETCVKTFDLPCVFYTYSTDPETPSLPNLDLTPVAGKVSLKAILDKIDLLIGQDFNLSLTKTNSSTVTLTGSGLAITAAVKISADAGNKIEVRADGLYVP